MQAKAQAPPIPCIPCQQCQEPRAECTFMGNYLEVPCANCHWGDNGALCGLPGSPPYSALAADLVPAPQPDQVSRWDNEQLDAASLERLDALRLRRDLALGRYRVERLVLEQSRPEFADNDAVDAVRMQILNLEEMDHNRIGIMVTMADDAWYIHLYQQLVLIAG